MLLLRFMVLVVGLEPTRSCPLRILSPVRLPFRHTSLLLFNLEVPPGFEPGNEGFADLCLTTWLWYQIRNGSRNLLTPSLPLQFKHGAEDGVRTRDLCLGKATLYQLSHSRISK